MSERIVTSIRITKLQWSTPSSACLSTWSNVHNASHSSVPSSIIYVSTPPQDTLTHLLHVVVVPTLTLEVSIRSVARNSSRAIVFVFVPMLVNVGRLTVIGSGTKTISFALIIKTC